MYVIPYYQTIPVCAIHMATKVQQFKNELPYPTYFGGVTNVERGLFRRVNGFSNECWGWGAEDDILRDRIYSEGIFNTESVPNGYYLSLPHPPSSKPHLKANRELLKKGCPTGLHDCEYTFVDAVQVYDHVTHLRVQL